MDFVNGFNRYNYIGKHKSIFFYIRGLEHFLTFNRFLFCFDNFKCQVNLNDEFDR